MRASTIHLWKFPISTTDAAWQWSSSLLSSQELERAGQYCTPALRNSFAFCRASAKCLLAGFTGKTDAADVVFTYGPFGKPQWQDVSFNVSHSANLCLIAISEEGAVGCDIQTCSASVDIDSIACSFHRKEQELLSALEPQARRQAFYRLWTRKEAVMKADGRGLGLGLENVIASIHSDNPWTAAESEANLPPERWWTPCFETNPSEKDCPYVMSAAIAEPLAPAHIVWHTFCPSR